MKKTAKTIRIFRLKNVPIEYIIETYMYHHERGTLSKINLEFMPQVGINVKNPKLLNKSNEHKKHITKLEEKFTYMIHLIYNRQIENGGGFVTLNSTILQKVFGDDYHSLLNVLMKLDLLYSDNYYIEGKKAIGYRFSNGVEFTYTEESAYYLSKYRDKIKEIFYKSKEKEEIKNREMLDNALLYNRYIESLNQLKLKYPDECKEFIYYHNFINKYSKDYYDLTVYKYQNREFTINIDNNKRIYHIGSSTPRLLKPFLNIKFQCDIHNSHPLLFCSLIYDYFNIPISLRRSLSSIFSTLHTISHNVRRNIRKTLINNGIDKEEIAMLPSDVLEYLYLTAKGLFWDTVLSETTEDKLLLRSDVKVLLFREVFYSKKLTNRGKRYGKMFQVFFLTCIR